MFDPESETASEPEPPRAHVRSSYSLQALLPGKKRGGGALQRGGCSMQMGPGGKMVLRPLQQRPRRLGKEPDRGERASSGADTDKPVRRARKAPLREGGVSGARLRQAPALGASGGQAHA